jgi:hypothetical protein
MLSLLWMQVGTQWYFMDQLNNYDGISSQFISLSILITHNTILVHFIKFLVDLMIQNKYNLHP